MSDFRALKGFMDKVYEAGQPFVETRKNYFSDCIHLPNFKRLSLEVAKASHAAEEELVVSIAKLGYDDGKKKQYLHEVTNILLESVDFTKLLQVNCHLMLQVLMRSEDIGKGPIWERAFLQMVSVVDLHWKEDLWHADDFPTLPISSRERFALYQIVGTGAYEGWQELNDEVDRQLRLVQGNSATLVHDERHADESTFNLKKFMDSVKIEAEIVNIFDEVLEEMKVVAKDSAGAYETIVLDSKGNAFIEVYRLLIAFKKLDEPKPGELQAWMLFFQAHYRARITEGVSKYRIASAQSKWFREEVKRAYPLIVKLMPGLKRIYQLPAIYQ